MNELEQLESQLLSWKPRRPSASLKKRIFAEKPVVQTLPAFAIGRWLAPAMALFIVSVVYLGTTPIESAPRWSLMATIGDSQPNMDTAFASAAPLDRNIWDKVTSFEWTNMGQSLSNYPR